ncbi:MAG: phosphoserine transaminase [Pseudomonadales bacterium]|nr:phosphoserine transaminase [Pseudomonadales bacterium]
MTQPAVKPANPNFSSGPCAKRPGYDVSKLDLSTQGRSHRSKIGKTALELACTKTAQLLNLPEGYRVGIVPASDTGAMEMIMWSTLGPRQVDLFAWESFGREWLTDTTEQLDIDVNCHTADYGLLPDFTKLNPKNDIIFTYNGTTSGVKVKNLDWISDEQEGIVICDATSAVFAMDIDWKKLDVITFSWQKVLGGEGAHGVLILSPKAVERLESYAPQWPMPKIFRLTNNGKLIEGIFKGATINTPSMLCVADYLDALGWVESIGGQSEAIKRSLANLEVIKTFVSENEWISFLAEDPDTLSNTSVCLKLDLDDSQIKAMITLLAEENVGYDLGAYKNAPSGLRIWCGATVQTQDVIALMPWIKWARETVLAAF